MTTLTINDDSLEARKFIEYALSLPFIEVDNRIRKEKKLTRKEVDLLCIPGLARTVEDISAAADQAVEDFRAGRTTSHEEMKKKIALWRKLG